MRRGRIPTHTKDYLLTKLVEASKILNNPFTRKEFNALNGFPSKSQYDKYFGSFNKAKIIAGLQVCTGGPKKGSQQKGGRPLTKPEKSKPWLRIRFEILERDNFTCQYCGRSVKDGISLEIDHIDPRSNGGDLIDKTNLITSCFECNRGKRDHILFLKNKNPKESEV